MNERTTTITCDSCGQSNRVPLSRLKDDPKCGSCKTSLPLGGGPIEVNDSNFDEILATSPVPIVVDFWAPWCGPCRTIGPSLAKIGAEKAREVLIAKVNVDENPGLSTRYQVRSIPHLVAFHHGKKISSQTGALPPAALSQWVSQAVAQAQG